KRCNPLRGICFSAVQDPGSLFLAFRTVVTAPSRNYYPLDGSPAHLARLSGSPINPMLQLKEAFFSVRSYIIGNTRSPQSNRFLENPAQGFVQPSEVVVSQRSRAPAWPNACTKQSLISVDISYTA